MIYDINFKDDCVNNNLKKYTFIGVKCSINICLLVGYNKKKYLTIYYTIQFFS